MTMTGIRGFERRMKAVGDTQVKKVKCSEFADAVIGHMG